MTTFRVKRLEKLTDPQLKELVDCCSTALRKDPGQIALLGGDLTLIDEYMQVMIRATLLEGLLYVVCVGPEHKEQIVSSGSYFAHGKYLFDRAKGCRLFQKLSPETQLWWTKTYPETIKPIDKRLFTPEEAKTRWWCYSLATHPDHQRRGYAAAIMDSVFEEVKRAGSFMGVVPATEVNVKIYTSMGFKEIGITLLPSPAGDCEIHVMTRGR